MQCKCGYELAESAKFCSECGQSAPEPVVEEKEDTILTFAEMVKFLKVSRSKLYDMVRKGEIPYFPIGSDKRFIREDVIAYMRGKYTVKLKDGEV